jgi:hypothetical protein
MRGTYYVYRASSDKHTDTINIHAPDGDLAIPIELFDALCVMRYAQLIKEKDISTFEREVAEFYRGNFGVDALCERVGIKTAKQLTDEEIEKQEKDKKA